MLINFWNGNHPKSENLAKMVKKYIPLSGPTESIPAECFRAANRILYEYYNNGFCNNKSPEWNYLNNLFKGSDKFEDALDEIRDYICGGLYNKIDYKSEILNNALNTIMEETLDSLIEFDKGNSVKIPTIEHMERFPDEYPEEDEDDIRFDNIYGDDDEE